MNELLETVENVIDFNIQIQTRIDGLYKQGGGIMTDNTVGIKFGVSGGVNGDSAKLIKRQLTEIAKKIQLQVKAKIDKNHFRSQLSSLRKELDKTLSVSNTKISRGSVSSGISNVSQETAEYKSLTKTLEDLYQTRSKLNNIKSANDKVKVEQEAAKLTDQYTQQLRQLIKIDGAESDRVKKVMQYKKMLDDANQAQLQNQQASPIDIAKLQLNAQSLHTDDGFDKIIARSEEAKGIVEGFNNKVKQALNQDSGITKSQVANLNAEFLDTQVRLNEIGRETDTVGNKIKTSLGKGLVKMLSEKLSKALKQVYQNVKEIDSAMNELQIATNSTSNQMDKAAKNISKAAGEIGISVADLTKTTTAYSRMGYDLGDAQQLAEKTTIYAEVAGLNVNEAAANINGIIKAYDIGADGIEAVLDKMIYFGNEFSISQADIGAIMNSAAGTLAENGNSLQESIAMVAAANTALQNIGESSNAVRAIAARISADRSQLEALGESFDGMGTFSELAQQMRDCGVEITGANGQLLSTYEILGRIASKWDNLNQTQQAAIASKVAGTGQQKAFYSIMQNWDSAQSAVSQDGNAVGALMQAQEVRLDSIDAKLERLKATWQSFSQNVLDSDIVKFFIDIVTVVAELLNKITALGDGAIPKFVMISIALIQLSAVVNSTGANMMSNIARIGTSLKQFLSNNAPMLIISSIIAIMTLLEGKAKGWSEMIIGLVMAVASGVILAIKLIRQAITGFMVTNPVGWILAAITAVVIAIKGIIDLVKAYNPSFDDLKNAAKECKDAWQEAKEGLEAVRDRIKEVQSAIDELNAKDKKSLVDEQDLDRLREELAILRQEEAIKESEERAAQRDAMNAAEKAIDKYKRDNTIKDGNGSVIQTFDSRIAEALKDFNNSKEREWAEETLKQYRELLSGFEYGANQKLNSYFDEYYKLLDMYTASTDSSAAAWGSIVSRSKNKEAIDALKAFADSYQDTSNITGDAIKDLAAQTPEVQKLFDYLTSIGMWDGNDWDKLTVLVGNLRTKLAELATVDIRDDIEIITDKFDMLSKALSDVNKNGIVSLNTLKEMAEKYPELLDKYFSKGLDGYTLSDKAYDANGNRLSDFEILKDAALTDIEKYKSQLEAAKLTLFGGTDAEGNKVDGLKIGYDDYETALKNYAVAQDNVNTKIIEWASALREVKAEEEGQRLEEMQKALEERLNIYKELIDIRKDLITTYKEEADYQKELGKKQKNVADLQTQLSLARLDKSTSGQARARELESQLNEAQEDLDDYTLERAIQDITESLENEYDEYQQYIKEQTDEISKKIEIIATTLTNILNTVSGALNTNFTPGEMATLYTDLKTKENQIKSKGEKATESEKAFIDSLGSGETKSFIDAYLSGNFEDADKYYRQALATSNTYQLQTPDDIEKSQLDKLQGVEGAWGSGISATKKGDDGIVTFDGKEYKVENGGIAQHLVKKAYQKFGDRDIFMYNGDLYGCLDDSVVKLQARSKILDSNQKKADQEFEELKSKVQKQLGTYHTGGFVGEITNLKSNEEFAKLLNGELVATPRQMDTFMKKTLPKTLSYENAGGATINNYSPLIEIQCGDIDKNSLPQLNKLVNQAVSKIEKNIQSALIRTGYKKNF